MPGLRFSQCSLRCCQETFCFGVPVLLCEWMILGSPPGLELVTVKEESEDPDYYQFNIPGNTAGPALSYALASSVFRCSQGTAGVKRNVIGGAGKDPGPFVCFNCLLEGFPWVRQLLRTAPTPSPLLCPSFCHSLHLPLYSLPFPSSQTLVTLKKFSLVIRISWIPSVYQFHASLCDARHSRVVICTVAD